MERWEVSPEAEKILGPAIWYDGTIYSKAAPHRHHHVLHEYAVRANGLIISSIAGGIQGFYTNKRAFIDRKEAKTLAKANGQSLRDTGHNDTLFTEDMW